MVSAQIYVGLPPRLQKPISHGLRLLDAERIIEVVSEELNVSIEDIKSSSRKQPIIEARCICINLIMRIHSYTLKEIGRFFGGIHHSTCIHSREHFKDLYGRDKQFTDKVETVKKVLLINKS